MADGGRIDLLHDGPAVLDVDAVRGFGLQAASAQVVDPVGAGLGRRGRHAVDAYGLGRAEVLEAENVAVVVEFGAGGGGCALGIVVYAAFVQADTEGDELFTSIGPRIFLLVLNVEGCGYVRAYNLAGTGPGRFLPPDALREAG